jgi:hypothetical protein
MAECLHHGERLVASADVSIMICPLQFLPEFPGFQPLWQKTASVRSRSNPSRPLCCFTRSPLRARIHQRSLQHPFLGDTDARGFCDPLQWPEKALSVLSGAGCGSARARSGVIIPVFIPQVEPIASVGVAVRTIPRNNHGHDRHVLAFPCQIYHTISQNSQKRVELRLAERLYLTIGEAASIPAWEWAYLRRLIADGKLKPVNGVGPIFETTS